jgi:hypothetical protein
MGNCGVDTQRITRWQAKQTRARSNCLLCGERPAYNLIGDAYLEMIVAVDAGNPLVALCRKSVTRGNMDFLPSFAPGAFDGHDDVSVIFHCTVPRAVTTGG